MPRGLTEIIRSGTAAELEELLRAQPTLAGARIVDEHGRSRTPLHVVTDWPGNVPEAGDKVRALLAAGADVNARFIGPHSETALHWAASCDDVDALDALLDGGADIEAGGAVIGGGTPLADAVAFGQWRAARRLLERGAETNLWQAAALGLTDRVRQELDRVPPPGQGDLDNALWCAAHGGQRDAAELLLRRGANPAWVGHDQLDAAGAAERSGASDLAGWLGEHMERPLVSSAVAADAAAVAELLAAVESSLYGHSTLSQADLEDDWSEIDLERDARVVRVGGRVVGYGAVHERGEVCHADGCVDPDALGRGIGKLIATTLEEEATRRGARRIHNNVLERDAPARTLLESLGYVAVRVFREMRIELEAAPRPPEWPDGLRVVAFDPERDAQAFHAAHQEAFADHWDYAPRDFESWSKRNLGGERFDPTLWCVVRAGDEIAAGTVSTADTYGGGFIHAVFTRRPWRRKGVGAALLGDAFGRFWARGERSIGLGVDAESDTGAFRLYERVGMTPALGWVIYEKHADPPR